MRAPTSSCGKLTMPFFPKPKHKVNWKGATSSHAWLGGSMYILGPHSCVPLAFVYRGLDKNVIAVTIPVALTIFLCDQLEPLVREWEQGFSSSSSTQEARDKQSSSSAMLRQDRQLSG